MSQKSLAIIAEHGNRLQVDVWRIVVERTHGGLNKMQEKCESVHFQRKHEERPCRLNGTNLNGMRKTWGGCAEIFEDGKLSKQ